MATKAAGVFKSVAYKVEASYGVVPAAASAQALRRVSSDLDLRKDTYQSNEIRTDQQVSDFRHGVRRVDGTIQGELSPKTYADFMAAALRRDFAAVSAIGSLSLTIAGTGPTYTVTRGSGSWITGGIKRGMVIRLSGTGLDALNVAKNLLVTDINAGADELTVRVLNASAMKAEGPIADCTATPVGKYTYVPQSGHTDKSFSIEHWYADVTESEVFSGCQPSQIDIALPPTGMGTISVRMMGKDITTAGSQYFTSPTAATTTGLVAAVNGLLLINGTPVDSVTNFQMSIASNRSGDPVVGSNVIPQMFAGRVIVTGQLSAYFEDGTYRDAFVNETEVEITLVLTTTNAATADFLVFNLPRCKLGGASKTDGEAGIVMTLPFQALLNSSGGAAAETELTTISVQDSAA